MPTYNLIGEEAYDLLTLGGYYVTPLGLLRRANLNAEERNIVYDDISFSRDSEQRLLKDSELAEFAQKLRASECFRSLVEEKSKKAYQATVGYFRQEGLLEEQTAAIVDSGWTGSMQRSLHQLLDSTGKNIQLTGFYFGMFAEPKETEDGIYLTWYFNKRSKKLNKVLFCNNLFECMLSAPHGMTLGYEDVGPKFKPVLMPQPSDLAIRKINEQISGVLAYTDEILPTIKFETFNQSREYGKTQKLLRRLMAYPSWDEAAVLGSFSFCDDVTEEYQFSLAGPEQIVEVKEYLMLPRIIRKCFSIKKKKLSRELFWIYGTIAFLPNHTRWWYRLNVVIWEWLRYTLK